MKADRTPAQSLRSGSDGWAIALLIVSLAYGAPAANATTPDRPAYANGEIHCPDGTSSVFQSTTGEEPNEATLKLACDAAAMLNEKVAFEKTIQVPAREASAPTPSADAAPAIRPDSNGSSRTGGVIHCPDGTTRPGLGGNNEMGGLYEQMVCSKPAAGDTTANAAMERKNRDIAISDARAGRVSLWTAVKTAWTTGDTLLIAYLAGKFAFFAAIIGFVVFLMRRK